jgi:hypothetical protein
MILTMIGVALVTVLGIDYVIKHIFCPHGIEGRLRYCPFFREIIDVGPPIENNE